MGPGNVPCYFDNSDNVSVLVSEGDPDVLQILFRFTAVVGKVDAALFHFPCFKVPSEGQFGTGFVPVVINFIAELVYWHYRLLPALFYSPM